MSECEDHCDGSHDDSELNRALSQLVDLLEQFAEIMVARATAEIGAGGDWEAFLRSHPELTEPPRVGDLHDELLVAAVAEAWRQNQADERLRRHCGVDSHNVTCVLIDVPRFGVRELRPHDGDVIRVGQRLSKLAKAGRIMLASKPWESRHYRPIETAS